MITNIYGSKVQKINFKFNLDVTGQYRGKLIGFILLPFYTKWLGTEGYGLSDLITMYSNFLIGFITLCLSDSLLIFAKEKTAPCGADTSLPLLISPCLCQAYGQLYFME